MQIKVDFHVHTSYSDDGVSCLEDLIVQAQRNGIDALVICDHNQWFSKERLDKVPHGEILLLPGCEFSTNYGHLIGVFFDFYPLNNTIITDIQDMVDFDTICDQIHTLGGICILPHPYQNGDCPVLDFSKIDAVEIFNARSAFRYKNANQLATQLANRHNILGLSSSDAHSKWEIGNAYTILEVSKNTREAIRQGIMDKKAQYYNKNTPAIYKGISQWTKRVRQRRYLALPKAFVYLCYCILKDILHC